MLNSVEAETLTNIPNQVDNTTNSDPDQKLDSFESALAQLDQLKNQIPKNAYKKAKEELEYIYESDDVIDSPLFADLSQAENMSFSHDYTQYTPRSHYNKNSVLRSYFRSMMWYGRQNFLLISDELTRDAVYITLLLDETDQFSNWSAIYEPTTFLVGKSDDLGLIEYASALKQADITQLDADSISSLRTELQAYDSAQIMSSPVLGQGVFEKSKAELQEMTQGFRFMGQRFTPDAFIFSSLTQGDEKADPETGEKLPSDTTALMVMSVLGNQTATPYRDDWISKQAPNSSKVLSKKLTELTNYFARLDQNQWTQNLYWSWLYTLKSLFSAPVTLAGYPEFMKKSLWNEKTLQTVLGSWTELKHDTLLYAKQSYAEFGAGGEGEIPPVPKGYVEPNIEFLDRLIALVKMTDQGLRQYDLLDPNLEGRNEKLIESLEFFRQIAVKQLQNQIISDDNFEQLRNEGGSLGYLMMPIFNEQPTEKSARSALVADVHTNIPEKNILYEANGIPHYIYVAIKDVNGTRLTKGLTYSYYEFHQPIDSRLTDEKWQSWQYRQDRSQVPPQPEWAQELLK